MRENGVDREGARTGRELGGGEERKMIERLKKKELRIR